MAIDQVIPLFGQVALRKDVARTLENAEERAYAALVWDTLADAKLAYVELQRTQARLHAVRVGLSEIEKIETIVSERAAAGANAVYDRLRVSVERGKWDARVVDAGANLANAQVALAEAISPTIDARNLTVPEAMNEVPLTTRAVEDVDALVRAAMAHRPDLESARLRVAANDASVSLQRRQVLPSPDVSVGYARLFDVPNSPVSGGGAFLAGVSIPLPLLDRGQGSIERARAMADEERARHDKMLVSVRRDIERAARTATMTRENWHRFQQTTAEQVQRLRAIAEFAYREGRATILELLDAHAAHVDAEERRIELEARAVKAALELERATGPRPDGR
jgi:outer membrane protein TolC